MDGLENTPEILLGFEISQLSQVPPSCQMGNILEMTLSLPVHKCHMIPMCPPKQELGFHLDSTRFLINDDDAGMESDSDVKELSLGEDWEDKDLQEIMFKLAVKEGDDPLDENWLPYELKKKPKIGQFL